MDRGVRGCGEQSHEEARSRRDPAVPEGSSLGNVGTLAPRRSGGANRMFSAFAGWCWRQHLGFQPVGEYREKRTFLHLINNQPINKQATLLT